MSTDTDTLLAGILTDRVKRIETLLDIEDKQQNLIPFKLNPIQRRMISDMTGRDVMVKPSQIGASSAIIGDLMLDTITRPGTVSVIVSHEEFITQRLLVKAQTYYDHLKEKIPSIPSMHHKSSNLKTFPDIHSSFYVGSARAYVFGRGETIHNLLCDEYAFWDEDAIERIMAAISQRVPVTGRIIVLSTPNGEGNSFHEIYMNAKEGAAIGKSVYTPHFYAWYEHDEYMLSKDSPYCLPGDNVENLEYTDEEQLLITHRGLTPDQIRWRRRKIVEFESLRRSGTSRVLFQQEYPEDDVSCFLTAGDMAYNAEILNGLAKGCSKPEYMWKGAKIWYPPMPNNRYVISTDVGVAKHSETVITVWHCYTKDGKEWFKHCASLSGLIMPGPAAELALDLGLYYNKGLITWDAASQGIAFGDVVYSKYGNIYYREDLQSGARGRVPGWLTSPRTKLYMYDQLCRALPNMITHDINLVSQMKNMRVINEKLVSVGLDDFHDSAGIAICCRGSVPVTVGFAGTSGWKRF
jgi:hypothetical protein